jgi:hypothetical protein
MLRRKSLTILAYSWDEQKSHFKTCFSFPSCDIIVGNILYEQKEQMRFPAGKSAGMEPNK